MTIEKLHPWHRDNYKKLMQSYNRLPSAILLCGSSGLGIYNLAINFIASLLCENISGDTFCGSCSSCLLLQQKSHPDLFLLSVNPDDENVKSKNITVDMVREAINFAYLSPNSAKYRVIFLENANLLNQNSANALLKILEEPPEYVVFILITDSLGRILPTIRSRCQRLMVKAPLALNNKYSSTNDTSVENISDSGYSKFWSRYYNYEPMMKPQISDEDLLILINTLLKPSIDNIFICTDTFNGKKIGFGFTLEFFYKWLTDLGLFINTNQLQIFSDYSDTIKPLLAKIDKQQLFYLFDELNFLLRWSNHPFNYKLQIENFLFQYQSLFVSK